MTRFDVTSTTTTRAFFHYSVGGELAVEGQEILEQQVKEVLCRWCNTSKNVMELETENS